ARHHLTEHEAYLANDARDRRVSGRKANLSPTTVARYLNPVKSALEWGESVELLSVNPARTWKIAQTPPPERPHFEQADAARFITAVKDSTWAPHLLTLTSTGMRLSELRGLRWTDVDLDAGTYQIQQQWQTVMEQQKQPDGALKWRATDVRRGAPKSRAGIRGGGIPAAVCEVLRTWRTRQKEARLAAGRRWKDPFGGALLFANDTGQPFNTFTLRAHFYRLCAREQLPKLSIHDLRHSYVTLSLGAGVAEHLVPMLAGHSPRVDALVYRHKTARQGKEASELLWGFVAGDRAPQKAPDPPKVVPYQIEKRSAPT
ncbi:MAG TPA: tyrosine-type recombinase/integrase, partial [Chloroflexota bacterium]|nr:tyrosine-type recombinase/integrase [Chloroflexota bacterium]